MSCFKIFFIFVKILFIFNVTLVKAKEPNQVTVAIVNNHNITAQDVLNAMNTLPKKIKAKPLSEIYPKIVDELINQHLITKQAYKEKLDSNREVINLLKKNKDQLIAKYWLNNFIQNQIKEEKIQEFYKNYLRNFKSTREYNASHILVKEKKLAEKIIKKLKIKSEFSQFAKNFSIGPSKKNGGKLGWFLPGQMLKEFENATFQLKKGDISKTPVKTKFGYHIIMLNDVRNSKPKEINEIKEKIIKRIKQNSLSKLEKEIRNNQNIKIVDFKQVVEEINN